MTRWEHCDTMILIFLITSSIMTSHIFQCFQLERRHESYKDLLSLLSVEKWDEGLRNYGSNSNTVHTHVSRSGITPSGNKRNQRPRSAPPSRRPSSASPMNLSRWQERNMTWHLCCEEKTRWKRYGGRKQICVEIYVILFAEHYRVHQAMI